jgi:hypothetical protein
MRSSPASGIGFELRANPCVSRNGKRLGLLQLVEQEQWIQRKGRHTGLCFHNDTRPLGQSRKRLESM